MTTSALIPLALTLLGGAWVARYSRHGCWPELQLIGRTVIAGALLGCLWLGWLLGRWVA